MPKIKGITLPNMTRDAMVKTWEVFEKNLSPSSILQSRYKAFIRSFCLGMMFFPVLPETLLRTRLNAK